jgi:membrane associated rhomboid family serine protease
MLPISDSERSRRFPFFNLLFIIANIVVFYFQLTTPDPEGFINTYALIPAHVNFADLSTLTPFFTAMFLHGGFLHIASNMLFLWVFGDNVEGEFPLFIYPLVYLAAGIFGNFAQYLLDPHSTLPALGASGAIAGSLGAYFAFFPRHRVKTVILLPFFFTIAEISAGFMLGYWIILQIISGLGMLGGPEMGGVAYFAHIGGFAFGFLMAKILPHRDPQLQEI